MKLEIAIKLKAAVRYDEEAGVWVSWCPALDVYSQGTSRQRAQEAVEEALVMYVRYCFQKKKLGKVLDARGFEPVNRGSHPVENADGDDQFDEFIGVRVVHDQRHTPTIFDITVPLPLVATAQMVAA